MRIAVDFDDTLTADAELWRGFIKLAHSLGHHVVCVTSRRKTEDNRQLIREWMRMHGVDIAFYMSSLGSKVKHMENIGLPVDIWIDDDPERCALGH